jgi:O-acetyl-ADP-ribose deacetylase (regulator of RNase III)
MNMIERAAGNILEANAEALVNTVNTVGVMGKGIALQFRQAFPRNYEIYRRACLRGDVKAGLMLVTPTGRFENPTLIVNFPTKRHWKGRSRLEDIDAGLTDLVRVIKEKDIHSIAIPPLGCGNGGLDWNIVRPRIEHALAAVPDTRVLLFAPDGAPAVDDMPVATSSPKMTPGRAALLAAMIVYAEPGYRLSMLEIQKLAYFLQEAGEPLRLGFVKGQYGPYAEALHHVLQRIEGHYIRGYGDRSQDASIQVLPPGYEGAAAHLRDHRETEARLQRVSSLIEGFETPRGVELLATVDWVAKNEARATADPEVAVSAVHAWNDHKRRAFPAQQIRAAWQQLRTQDWI